MSQITRSNDGRIAEKGQRAAEVCVCVSVDLCVSVCWLELLAAGCLTGCMAF